MELTFPFKNITYNYLLKLFEVGIINAYYETELKKEEWAVENYTIQFYRERIPSFENEILQVIETTNQETIDLYFRNLSQDIKYIGTLLTEENISTKIEEWNNKNAQHFNDTVEQKEKEFHSSPLRKRNHLEEYEEVPLPFLWGGIIKPVGKLKKINYNFFCIDEKLLFIDPEISQQFITFLKSECNLFIDIAKKYGIPWHEGKIKAKDGNKINLKPILFCEGDIDLVFINRAAELLDKTDLIKTLELRQRGSCNNLDKLWTILTDNNWETVPQKKILLYDCDTNRKEEDFGHIHRRTLPKLEHLIQRGIENLFPDEIVKKGICFKKEFVDFENTTGILRGEPYNNTKSVINKDEKRNFANWILANAEKEHFIHFKIIFEKIEAILID
jgi:hypothetical protein